MVAARAFNERVVSQTFAPFTCQVYPDKYSSAQLLAEYLTFSNRSNYVSILYPSTDSGIQSREIVGIALDQLGFEWFSASYLIDQPSRTATDHILAALQTVQDRGFRTIVVTMENPELELPSIAEAADTLGMNNGDYVWVWFGPFFVQLLYSNDPVVYKLLFGSTWLAAADPFVFAELFNKTDSFSSAITSQSSNFVNQVNAMNPIQKGEPGYVFANPAYFTDIHHTEYLQSFIYDAIMSIGIGGCLAEQEPNGTIPGTSHIQGISEVNFSGASGTVQYNKGSSANPGARLFANSTYWIAFNLIPTLDNGGAYSMPAVLIPGNSTWTKVEQYIYGDGSNLPPPLRDPPNENYLSHGLTALGFVLMAMVVLSSLATAMWVYVNRMEQVLRAAQPMFLYALALGSAVFSLAIAFLSFDEGDGLSVGRLSKLCMTVPWLVSIGHVITYGALFAKLYRVNKVLQFTRRKVGVQQAVWPSTILLLAALILLAIWTALDPMQWRRIVLDPYTGDSIGRCESNNMTTFVSVLVVVLIIPMFLTGWMAWKTKDVDDAYTESSWIFALIALQLEITLVGTPVIAILRNLSSNGRYVGYVIILWIFPMSTLTLIMLPKFMALRRAKLGIVQATSKRGQRGTTRVTGIETSPAISSEPQPQSALYSSAFPQASAVSEQEYTAISHENNDQPTPEPERTMLAQSADHSPAGVVSIPIMGDTRESEQKTEQQETFQPQGDIEQTETTRSSSESVGDRTIRNCRVDL